MRLTLVDENRITLVAENEADGVLLARWRNSTATTKMRVLNSETLALQVNFICELDERPTCAFCGKKADHLRFITALRRSGYACDECTKWDMTVSEK